MLQRGVRMRAQGLCSWRGTRCGTNDSTRVEPRSFRARRRQVRAETKLSAARAFRSKVGLAGAAYLEVCKGTVRCMAQRGTANEPPPQEI
ncbi:Uncharacterized protein HZ326_21321 [Fusarium oxysporum f. sp. albedinis]|nr:Uncharacterized protein HZ326_21321 [Fusarium oxysporum f. sp. albedinis]